MPGPQLESIGMALQGLGAGGLMALTFVIIGDIVPPRERGRYQGYFGAVWGLSSVAGPLLGGFFCYQAWAKGGYKATAPFSSVPVRCDGYRSLVRVVTNQNRIPSGKYWRSIKVIPLVFCAHVSLLTSA